MQLLRRCLLGLILATVFIAIGKFFAIVSADIQNDLIDILDVDKQYVEMNEYIICIIFGGIAVFAFFLVLWLPNDR